ncbi:hypothetical protein, partial [Niallia circulans]|uniref:hypothetical protein n=1 Tax=Niallia circulans TaxID=1397 RepID=UPI00155FBE77
MISFFENYKVIVPLIATFIGIIGTILIQFLIKFFDSSITKKKEINIFKARVEILIRKIEPALNIPITNQNEINKEVAIRSLKDSYMKLDIFKEMVNKCLECEEYSLNQSHLNVIKRINDLLW